MITEDLNEKNLTPEAPDSDFIIKEGKSETPLEYVEVDREDIEEKLDAAGIKLPEEHKEKEEETVEENNSKVEASEDLLLQQIDAFREKAKTIQSLIKDKETRVIELEEQLRVKEAQNAEIQIKLSELEAELEKKHQEADGLVTTVETQVDRVLQELREEMTTLQSKVADAAQTQEIQDTLSSVSQSVEGIKNDLYDKVHNENVKVYRNIQDLLKERDEQDTSKEENETQFKKVGGKVTFTTVLGVLNLGVVVAILLSLLGII
ncbi:MAG: hypothetical protein K5675_07010 [Lachnospiraceae bacterium]|nr:hypothetical protein [Lachnospiraceae bacterium]